MDDSPKRSVMWEWFALGIPAGALFGIRIRLHVLLLLALLYNWRFYADLQASASWRIGLWLFSFGALFLSVLLHELGHCYGARRVGGHVEQIVLWPLGGLAYVSGGEKGPREELVVTILGPAVSLGLALSFSVLFLAANAAAPFWLVLGLEHLAFLNWILFAFNLLLPLFPMDCARILRGVASLRLNPNRVTYVLATFGIYLGVALAILAFFRMVPALIGPWLGLIGLLGAIASYQERKRLEFSDVYADGPWYWRDSGFDEDSAHSKKSVVAEVRKAFSTLKTGGATAAPPLPAAPKNHSLTEREQLQKELREAAEHEDFLRAAELRDRIRRLGSDPNKKN